MEHVQEQNSGPSCSVYPQPDRELQTEAGVGQNEEEEKEQDKHFGLFLTCP